VIEADGRQLVNFGSNDYLGLAADPRLAAAAAEAAMAAGCGAGASPLVTGHADAHRLLEARLAEFEHTEAALVFSSGYAANLGAISALVGPGDAIYSDQSNHASMIDGCRLSRAAVHVYPHNDMHALAARLADSGPFRRRLIVSESLFSMSGDVAPLIELVDLAERHRAMLLVDEAHATGVFGANGRGLAEHLGIEERVHARVGTLSKSLGAAGGYVCGSRSLIDWLINTARPYVFSTALAPPIVAAATAALDIVREEPFRRTQLLERAAGLRARLLERGWQIGASESQIVPLVAGAPELALEWSRQLRAAGLLVPAIRPPSVPEGQALLRISLSWGHSPEMIERLAAALDAMQLAASDR
jgi:8-amino-7-oxononanoate synthase